MVKGLEDLALVIAKAKLVNERELKEAVATSKHLELPLSEVLLGRRLVSKEDLGRVMAEAMGVGYVDLKASLISQEVLRLIGEDVAIERKVVAFAKEGNKLSVAMIDPADLETVDLIKKLTGMEVVPFLAFEKDVKFGLRQYKGSLVEEFQQLVGQVSKSKIGSVSLTELAEDVSIVEAVNKLLEFAVIEEASDVHIEAVPNLVLIRYRIDGVLHDVLELPKDLHPAIIARIKILSGLKLDETRQPQDGRMKFVSDEGEEVSLRVSVLPVVEGEKVVLRVLEGGERQFSFEGLGLAPEGVVMVRKAMSRPHGLIMVTGPTGSGKTTTLYTMLSILNTAEVNVSTVEDPVEQRIRRVNQMQVNPLIDLSFAKGLRALLRQDPDVIMVGEIRDSETAKMAVNASMTGHLVLSTLHTNDAPGAIPRLEDLGAEPFLVASTLEMVIAQRLVRKICNYCRTKKPFDPAWNTYLMGMIRSETEKEQLAEVMPSELVYGSGCDRCHYTGYSGRLGIYEIFPIDEKIRELILEKATASKIKAEVLAGGMKTMLVDGLLKVKQGVTTMDEVLRVAFT